MATGYFVIADITGYTRFLTTAELDHAQGILEGLFGAMLGAIDSPLRISNFQGDAVLCYAPDDGIGPRDRIVDAVERVYCAFSERLEQMVLNTTCTCTACKLLPDLDLKLFVHHGGYLLQQLGDRQELAGPDVIAVHRLTKNGVTEATGLRAYAVFTDAAIAATGLQDHFARQRRHVEQYEHLGDVGMAVVDMREMYHEWRQARPIGVKDGDPLWVPPHVIDLPDGAAETWRYMVDPELYARWAAGVTRFDALVPAGQRMGVGAELHCYHGKAQSRMTVVEWRPPARVTWQAHMPFGVSLFVTSTVTARPEGGSRLVQRIGRRLQGGNAVTRLLVGLIARLMIVPQMRKGMPLEVAALQKLAAARRALPAPAAVLPEPAALAAAALAQATEAA